MLPDFPAGTRVKLNGSGLNLHRKTERSGTSGIAFADGLLSDAEAKGHVEWLATGTGRDATVRSLVSGTAGELFRGLFRKA